MRKIQAMFLSIRKIHLSRLLPAVIIFSLFLCSAEGSSTSRCKYIADSCSRMDRSFQFCFNHFTIPRDGELPPVGAQIQVTCEKNIVACGGKILGGDQLFCVGTDAQLGSTQSRLFPLSIVPNDVCKAFSMGGAIDVGVSYVWCPKLNNPRML